MKNAELNIIPLGGLEEVGKNFTAVEYREEESSEWIIIDAGLKFPDKEEADIDIIIPDFTFLKDKKQKIGKIFITHAHEDHIGAIEYFMEEFPNCQIFCTDLTSELVKKKLKSKKWLYKNIHIINRDSIIDVGQKTKVHFFATNHSIPGSVGIIFKTPLGNVVHTGDFKIDYTNKGKNKMDFGKIGDLEKEGVLILLSDSTNSEKIGFSPSEQKIQENIEKIIKEASGRVIVSTFASSLIRIEKIFELAKKQERKIYLAGKKMEENVQSAMKTGYLKEAKTLLLTDKELLNTKDENILIVSTGGQGEMFSGLARIVRGEHPLIHLKPQDTVILSSSPIPGNEKAIGQMIDDILKKGANIEYGAHVHTSGHGYQEEQKMMIQMMEPKYFVPIHGEYRMLVRHAKTAKTLGVDEKNIFICTNGDCLHFDGKEMKKNEKVKYGNVYINQKRKEKVEEKFILEKRRIHQNGIAIIDLRRKKIVLKAVIQNYDKKGLENKLFNECLHEKTWKNRRELYQIVRDFLYAEIKKSPIVEIL